MVVILIVAHLHLIGQPIDILHILLVFFLWFERCTIRFDDHYFRFGVLSSAWTATIQIGMATWHALQYDRDHRHIGSYRQ